MQYSTVTSLTTWKGKRNCSVGRLIFNDYSMKNKLSYLKIVHVCNDNNLRPLNALSVRLGIHKPMI